MAAGQAEACRRLVLEVELDHDGGLGTDDPAVVPRLDGEHRGRRILLDAAVGIPDVDAAAREEPDVRMRAEVGLHQRFHVVGPTEADWIDHPLHARVARADDFELHAANGAAVRTGNWRRQRVHRAHWGSSRGILSTGSTGGRDNFQFSATPALERLQKLRNYPDPQRPPTALR
jgi:hypothetical protein